LPTAPTKTANATWAEQHSTIYFKLFAAPGL